MPPKSSYFLYGYFGAGNFGDDVLLYAAIQNILLHDPDATFLIRNYGCIDFEKDFPGRVLCTDMEKIHNTGWPSAVKFLVLLHSYWNYMGRVSTLVVGGGTLIHDSPNLESTFLLLCLCLAAKIRGRKILGIGLGVQTLKTVRGRIVARCLVRLFDRLCLRDQRSYDQLKLVFGGCSNLALTADLAYARPDDRELPRMMDKIIGVTLADYLLERLDTAMLQSSLMALTATLTDFIKDGYQIRLLSLQKERSDLGVTGDSLLLEKIREGIPFELQGHLRIIALEATPNSIANAYGGVCLTIGMRFHSLIFSSIRHIPFAGLTHEPKVTALCDDLFMPCLATDNWNKESLTKMIRTGLGQTIDPLAIDRYRRRALDNFEQFRS